MESLMTLGLTGTECIANRQTFFSISIDRSLFKHDISLINIPRNYFQRMIVTDRYFLIRSKQYCRGSCSDLPQNLEYFQQYFRPCFFQKREKQYRAFLRMFNMGVWTTFTTNIWSTIQSITAKPMLFTNQSYFAQMKNHISNTKSSEEYSQINRRFLFRIIYSPAGILRSTTCLFFGIISKNDLIAFVLFSSTKFMINRSYMLYCNVSRIRVIWMERLRVNQ